MILAFVNSVSEVQAESQLDSFIVGFRLGARFVFDTFVDDTAPYRDLIEDIWDSPVYHKTNDKCPVLFEQGIFNAI